MTDRPQPPRCQFYIRSTAPDGLYRYTMVNKATPGGTTTRLTMHTPPAVGDTISLWDDYANTGGLYEVIARSWTHASYGSPDWPPGQKFATSGPLIDLIVTPAVGPFRDESPVSDDPEEQP